MNRPRITHYVRRCPGYRGQEKLSVTICSKISLPSNVGTSVGKVRSIHPDSPRRVRKRRAKQKEKRTVAITNIRANGCYTYLPFLKSTRHLTTGKMVFAAYRFYHILHILRRAFVTHEFDQPECYSQ